MYVKRRKIREITRALKEGNQITAILAAMGMSSATLWRWSHQPAKFSRFYHSRVETVISRAQENSENKRHAIVEGALFKKLKDGTATAAEYIFYLCNRDQARWKNVKDTSIQLQQSTHLHVDDIRSKALAEMSDNEIRSVLDGIINRRRNGVSSL